VIRLNKLYFFGELKLPINFLIIAECQTKGCAGYRLKSAERGSNEPLGETLNIGGPRLHPDYAVGSFDHAFMIEI
jgi:hypothetical protein